MKDKEKTIGAASSLTNVSDSERAQAVQQTHCTIADDLPPRIIR